MKPEEQALRIGLTLTINPDYERLKDLCSEKGDIVFSKILPSRMAALEKVDDTGIEPLKTLVKKILNSTDQKEKDLYENAFKLLLLALSQEERFKTGDPFNKETIEELIKEKTNQNKVEFEYGLFAEKIGLTAHNCQKIRFKNLYWKETLVAEKVPSPYLYCLKKFNPEALEYLKGQVEEIATDRSEKGGVLSLMLSLFSLHNIHRAQKREGLLEKSEVEKWLENRKTKAIASLSKPDYREEYNHEQSDAAIDFKESPGSTIEGEEYYDYFSSMDTTTESTKKRERSIDSLLVTASDNRLILESEICFDALSEEDFDNFILHGEPCKKMRPDSKFVQLNFSASSEAAKSR